MEFIMEAPQKLNTDYGQLPPPAGLQKEVPLGSLTPSRSLVCRPGVLSQDGDPYSAGLQRR